MHHFRIFDPIFALARDATLTLPGGGAGAHGLRDARERRPVGP
jgi:hypothetical protein